MPLQPHPASAAAAAVLVAHASSLGPNANAMTKYNADGGSVSSSPSAMEQGMGQGPLGQGLDVIATGPLVRQQTMGPVSHLVSAYCIWLAMSALQGSLPQGRAGGKAPTGQASVVAGPFTKQLLNCAALSS